MRITGYVSIKVQTTMGCASALGFPWTIRPDWNWRGLRDAKKSGPKGEPARRLDGNVARLVAILGNIEPNDDASTARVCPTQLARRGGSTQSRGRCVILDR